MGECSVVMKNSTAIEKLNATKESRLESLISKLSKMGAEEIKSQLAKMHNRARTLPKRAEWEADQLHTMANAAENYFFLVLNPEKAFGANLEYAIKRGLPVPQIAA
jgi:hypothetical protein